MERIAGRDNSKENACTGDLQLRKQGWKDNLLRGGRKLKDRRWYSCALEVGDGYEKTDIRTNDKKIKVACDNQCDACCISDSIYFKEYPKDKIMMQATCDTKLTPLVHAPHFSSS